MNKDLHYFQELLQKDINKTVQELLAVSKKANEKDIHNNLIMQSGRLNSINNDNNMGVISRQDYNMEIAKIRKALLYIIDKLSDFFVQEEDINLSQTNNSTNISRLEQLQDSINRNYELLNQWEEKRDLSENPKENMRCEREIEQIKQIIKKYEDELNNMN